jgi:hypothetical protein
MSNKSPWSEALDKKILKWVEAKGMYEGWYDGLSHKWKHGVINQIREFFPAVIEDFQELKESLLESPARYSAEEYFESKKISMKGIHAGEYIDKEDFLSFIQSLPSNAETVEKKEEVNEWLKKNWPEGKFRAFIEFMKTDRLFFVDEVRKWLNAFLKEEISFSKFVELFNEKVFEKYPASPSPAVSAPVEERKRCEFEMHVIKYFGLPEDVNFNKVPKVCYADLVNLLATFTQSPVDETAHLLSTKANRERLEESIKSLQEGQERAKELYPYPENDLYKPGDPDLEQMIWVVNQKREAYLAGFAASKDYAKGLLEWVGKSYENIEDIVDKPALWKEVGFGADLSHYTTSQLIDLYDEHLKHLNQQK